MRWLEAQRCSRGRENARPRRAARDWQRVRSHSRLGSSGRRILGVGFHQRGRAIVGRPARRDSDAVKAVRERRAQIAGDQAVRLGAQELRPAEADPPRRRPQARATQHGRDRGRRDADPQPLQLTLDAHVAPAGVLPRQPRDQTARLGRKRGTTEPARPPSPISLQQRPVPPAKRLRADRKAGPPLGRQQAARRGEQGSVGVRVPRPLPSPPEDRQLVAQHDDLKLPLTATADKHRNENAQEPIEQRHQHDAQSEPGSAAITSKPVSGRIDFLHPTGCLLWTFVHLIVRNLFALVWLLARPRRSKG
jgi:hypothetical protein